MLVRRLTCPDYIFAASLWETGDRGTIIIQARADGGLVSGGGRRGGKKQPDSE
jgi:hypothetical protein